MDKERRKFKRFDAFMSVRYKNQDRTDARGISLSRDLSREGMKIQIDKPLDKGRVFDLEIDIPDDPKPIHTTAEVIWTRHVKGDNQGFEVGIRFVTMDPVDKFRVLDYAYNHWLETKVNDFADPETISETA